MPLLVDLTDQKSRSARLQPYGAPYGYSANCEASSLQFQAAPGDELTLKITRTAARAASAGYVLVSPNWRSTKDHIVGLDLDKVTASILKWLSMVGSLLVLSGAGVLARNRVRRVLG